MCPRRAFLLALLLCGFLLHPLQAALKVVVIGDSLSAEYDSLTGMAGVDDPSEYAAITVDGWESMSWVEVLGRLRGDALDFGAWRDSLPGWIDLRFTGYEFNYAIPGFEASQYEDIVNSSLFRNPQHYPFKLSLENRLEGADAAVVWLGGNEIRANFGALYDGGDPQPLINALRQDLGEILNFVRRQGAALRVVVPNLPDLGATPTKQAAHPDPAKRARVTSATILANQAIAEVAAAQGSAVADVFAATRPIVEGTPMWIGPIAIQPGIHADNHPQYAFTRDGLHPNTCLQAEIADIILGTFNEAFDLAIPPITDAETLALIGINPQQPFLDWVADRGVSPGGLGDDPEGDGLVNLVEFVFDSDPKLENDAPLAIGRIGDGLVARYRPDAARLHFAEVTPQWTSDLSTWANVPVANVTTESDGTRTIRFPAAESTRFLRLLVSLRPLH